MGTFMNYFSKTLWALVILTLSTRQPFGAEPDSKPAPSRSAPLKFRPPPVAGNPAVRVTGGSRGGGDAAVTLDVLAPATVGMTTQDQPSLFWYQSKPSPAKFELTVLEDKKVKPVVRVTVDRAAKAGIQRLKLSDYGAKLNPGVEYQWVVALITDPENRSTDLIASGAIKRVPPTAELTKKLSETPVANKAVIYADEGIWYDALASLSDQIEANPQDKSLRQARADLLRQVGLKAAAQSEAATP